ncbi:hypothetical protein [Tepidimonas sp.]|uniref:hypothetical protein n=1 Tax=Tepidimonas sp. TaxID=2002775 RepID=UPI00391C6AEF
MTRNTLNPALAARASATPLAPTPLAAALAQSGIPLPIPFLDLSAQVIRDLPLETVAALQRFISEAKSELGTLNNMLQTGLEMRYGEQAKAQLLAQGKDTGTTHIEDAGFDITVEIGKDVKWDAAGLAELVAKIEATGGDPREYVEIKYSVSEAKFKAWPQTLRAPFEALRTVTPKAPKFVLRRLDANGEGK